MMESQPRSTSILAQSLPSFENRPLSSIFLADLNQVEWRAPRGRKSGGRRKLARLLAEVVLSPVVPVLSNLMGLQGRLDLRCVPVPARVQRPLVMG